MDLPDDPVVIALGFEMGLYSRDHVSDWVDRSLARVEKVDGPLLELTTLRDKHDIDIIKLLNHLGHSATTADLGRVRLGVLYHLFTSGKIDLARTTAQLFRIGLTDFTYEGEPSEYCACVNLDDEYDLAARGTYGTLEQVQRDVLAFLEPYASKLRIGRS
jgi:hypothetical protein